MLSCINKNSKEFRDLKEMSGLSEYDLEVECRWFVDNMGRFPYLDELDNANSEPYLVKKLNLDNYNSTSIDTLFEVTGKTTVDSALSELNNVYRDLEVSGVLLNDGTIIINREHKPKTTRSDIPLEIIQDNTHSALIIDEVSDKLSTLYGIPIMSITTKEILQNEQLLSIPDTAIAKAFIYDNNIYVNTDNATLDSKIHELMHILFGSMKFTDPELYWNLVLRAELFENLDNIAKFYEGRTRGDVLEEVFITELSKYLVGSDSAIKNLSAKESGEIFYLTHRLLDAAFMGDFSTRNIPDNQLYNLTLKLVGYYVNSALTNQSFKGSITDAEISRMLANKKQLLIKEGKLKEYCG